MKVLIISVIISMALSASAAPSHNVTTSTEKSVASPISVAKSTPPPLSVSSLESAMLFANSISKMMPPSENEITPATNHGHGTELINGVMNTMAGGARLMSSVFQFLPAIGMLGSRAMKSKKAPGGSSQKFTQGNVGEYLSGSLGSVAPEDVAPYGKKGATKGKETPSGKSSTSMGKVALLLNSAFSGPALMASAMYSKG